MSLIRRLLGRSNSIGNVAPNVSGETGEPSEAEDDIYEQNPRRENVYYNASESMARAPWQRGSTHGVKPPHPLTVTHVNQTIKLGLCDVPAQDGEKQTSVEWLETHSLEHRGLTMQKLMDQAIVGPPKADNETGQPVQNLQFKSNTVNEFEYSIHLAIDTLTKRVKGLLAGSRRVFGSVKGVNVAVCIDSSDMNCGMGRLQALQESFMHLLDEQLSSRNKIYLVSFGSDLQKCWANPRTVNARIMDEARHFISTLENRGSCNLLRCLKHVYSVKGLDSIIVLLGSVPDQQPQVLRYYINQISSGRECPLHTVAYDCSNYQTNKFLNALSPPTNGDTLRSIAEETGGRYHCYSATDEGQIYTSTDIATLLREVNDAEKLLNEVKELRRGMMGNALVTILDQISKEVCELPQSQFLPRPPGHDRPLTIEEPKFEARTSVAWLRQHGLRAKKLDLYQILAPNAYDYRTGFVPVTRGIVSSKTHERAMTQVQWRDGSVKNVHVDCAQLYEYQRSLGALVNLVEKRRDWLQQAGRRIWGTIVEKRVIFLVDTSLQNLPYLVHLQHCLRLVLEQQMATKQLFNVISIGSEPHCFSDSLVRVDENNLQKAWKFALSWEAEGSRNFLAGYRAAVDSVTECADDGSSLGVYLLTSGVPDQLSEQLVPYLEQTSACGGISLHICLFTVPSEPQTVGRYATRDNTAAQLRDMAHAANGRFHWFADNGIIESDDITYLNQEVDRAVNFSEKCGMLVDQVKKKYEGPLVTSPPPSPKEKRKAVEEAWIEPRGTALTMAREELLKKEPEMPKTLAWQPPPPEEKKKKKSRPASARAGTGAFYTERKNDVGVTIKNYTAGRGSVRKFIPHVELPDFELYVTSREWLARYSLNKVGLNLSKLVSGPDCKHVEKRVGAIKKTVSAKYCHIFPSINVGGTVKHLQLLPKELDEYVLQTGRLLARYLRRLQWLLAGSRQLFGVIAHEKVIIMVDTSGSMAGVLPEVKRQLSLLVWEQLHKSNCSFNLISFNNDVTAWREGLVPAGDEAVCHDALRWIASREPHGNTDTLNALKLAFNDADVDAVYLLTDGKPDNSTSSVLRTVSRLNQDRSVAVNTISLDCTDSTANSFLKLLACETGGRYHRCHSDHDAQLVAHQLLSDSFDNTENLTLPEFDGDDLKRLASEIALSRRYLKQVRVYKQMYNDHRINQLTSRTEVGEFVVGDGKRTRPISAKV